MITNNKPYEIAGHDMAIGQTPIESIGLACGESTREWTLQSQQMKDSICGETTPLVQKGVASQVEQLYTATNRACSQQQTDRNNTILTSTEIIRSNDSAGQAKKLWI